MKSKWFKAVGILSIAFLMFSCKKEEKSNLGAGGGNSSNPNNPTSATVLATANFNYLDDGGAYSFQGVNHILYNNGQVGDIIRDSTLDIKFTDKSSDRNFFVRIEQKNMPVHSGVFDLYSTFNSASPYRLAFASSGANLPFFFDANSQPSGQYYNNQLVEKYGELVITSMTSSEITGTMNADLYSGNEYYNNVTNYTHKLEVRNMSFSGTYERVE